MGNPWDVTTSNAVATASTAVSIPGATTTVPDTLVVNIIANATDIATPRTSDWINTNLTNLIEITDVNGTAGNGGGFGSAVGVKSISGNYGSTSAILSTSSVQAQISLALLSVNTPTPTPGLAPQLIQEIETGWNSNTSPKTTTSFNVQAGDVLVAYSANENSNGTAVLGISGGALTWALQQRVLSSNYSEAAVWTATVDADKAMTASFTNNTGGFFGGNVLVFRNSIGVGSSVKANVSSGVPSVGITTTQDNSAVVVFNSDWNAVDGSSRVWRTNAGAFTEQTYFRDSARYTVYGGYHANVGSIGTYSVGLSAPSGQKYSIAAVEVRGGTIVAKSDLPQLNIQVKRPSLLAILFYYLFLPLMHS